jgi:uncharacterized protein YjbJ (UPF0337 family)
MTERYKGTTSSTTRRTALHNLLVRPHARFHRWNERSTIMGGKMDQVKGRIKEAAGAITDDKSLKREGQIDQAVGKVKETAAGIAKKVKEKVERAADTLKNS